MAGGFICDVARSVDISAAATTLQANMDQSTPPQPVIQSQLASSPENLGSGIIRQARKSKRLSCFLLTLIPLPNLLPARGGRCRTTGNQSSIRLSKLEMKEER
jgi:hypothetical protein